jgi:hypothetical protein
MFEELLSILQKYSQIRFERRDNLIRVLASTRDGFEVIIEQIWDNHFSVSYDNWHQDFYNWEDAQDCFLFGLSNRCRLKVQCKDAVPFRWTVERLEEEKWLERSSNSVWNYRFLSAPTTAYLQNDMLSDSDLNSLLNKSTVRVQQTA